MGGVVPAVSKTYKVLLTECRRLPRFRQRVACSSWRVGSLTQSSYNLGAMSLSRGTRLGPYEIVESLGQGGMGEVYRARDTKLNRDVAIKVLPPLLATDIDRLTRLQREAQTLASLNHPNIAQIYGLIDGPAALVMELVDGQDLSRRIAHGAIPIDEALAIARQIADALEAAHGRGIVHRDLKPANIRVRPDGVVKVLDFGLAIDAGRGVDPGGLADSPTFTSPAMLTQAGVILGTAAYMAPEQARGEAVDRRVDIWAFGCVFYEMLTGRRAFDGDSTADLLHAILGREPEWGSLPAGTPPRVSQVLAWCLRRDPAERLRDAGDIRLLLADSEKAVAGNAASPSPRRFIGAAAGWIVAVLASVALAWTRLYAPAPPTSDTLHLELPLSPPDETSDQQFASSFALSPDGIRLAYVAREGSSTALFLRDLETGASRQIPDSADAYAPFFSPDGSAVGFTAGDRLRTIALTAPLARDVAQVPLNGHALRVNGSTTASYSSMGVA
jgi:serine/threonine protein kinase